MAKIHEEMARALLKYTPSQKEKIGNNIVIALGGDPTKMVTSLPLRRGNSDGGIDGRIEIIAELDIARSRNGLTMYNSKNVKEIVNAAFSIKLQNKEFDRNQLGAFVEDIKREGIFDGIIVTILPFSTDAEYMLNHYNQHGNVQIRHILVEELLANEINLDFELPDGSSFLEKFNHAIRNMNI